jgi:hypothetical protein
VLERSGSLLESILNACRVQRLADTVGLRGKLRPMIARRVAQVDR